MDSRKSRKSGRRSAYVAPGSLTLWRLLVIAVIPAAANILAFSTTINPAPKRWYGAHHPCRFHHLWYHLYTPTPCHRRERPLHQLTLAAFYYITNGSQPHAQACPYTQQDPHAAHTAVRRLCQVGIYMEGNDYSTL